jgi:multidrug efflux pump subunit AcrA (membrane-fusion protein)
LNNLAEGGKQLARSGLRVAQGAGAGAIAFPTVMAMADKAGPDISRRYHNFNASTAASTAKNFTAPQADLQNRIRALTAAKVIRGPGANDAYLRAARNLGPTQLAELNRRLAAHGGFIDMSRRSSDSFLQTLYGQVQKDMAARRAPLEATLNSYKAQVAKAQAEEAAARAKAQAAAARTPSARAATRAGFAGRTNLWIGKLRNPILGALMGGGIQSGREASRGPDK